MLQGATNGNSWINISTASGPNSMGIVAPVIGGPGSGTAAAGNQGWSFEFVFKPSAAEYRTWAKLLDMGNGQVNSPYGTSMPPNADDWTIGFDGNDQTKFLVETYNSGTINYTHCTIETEAIAPSTWYHMAVVITPAPGQAAAQGGANWYVYVNGQMQNWAYPLNGGAPLSLSYLQGANYPQPVARPQSYIGKSDWADPVMDAEVDAVRIYDYALSMAVVQNLAALYGLNASTPTFPPAGSSAPGFTATAAEFTAPAQAAGLTFQPVFNAPFATNPAQLVGGSTAYTWMAFDPADSAAQQALHRGLINVNAAPTSYIDLAQVTGANSIGQTLPVLFGPSSGSGSTYGWSIDLCIKPLASQTWSKLIDLGTGAYIDSLYFGWQSNSNLWEFGNYITVQNSLAFPAGTSGTSFLQYTNVLEAPVLGQWYHLAWVMIPQSTDATFATAAASTMATWNIYVNGLLAVTMLGNTPLPLFRHVSYLGRSDWFQAGNGDQNLNATFDAFRVWDRALTAAQVQALSQTLYGLGLPPSVTSVSAGGDFSLQAALGTTARLPVFNANFSQNPNTIASVGPVTYYQWAPFDPTDSAANQGQHQGLAVLTGTPLSFINISTASGPNSMGAVVPPIGTNGSGSAAAGTLGWSFEFVWKPTGESRTWAKLLDLGNGASNGYTQTTNDDWTFGFDGSDQTQFLLETYNDGSTTAYSHAFTELTAITLGTWYHMVVVQTPVGTAGAAKWYIYLNGQLLNWAAQLNGGAPVTTMPQQGANYPLPVPRAQSYIGKSNWNDPTMIAVIDAVRIYDYALSGTQVSALANMYGMLASGPPYALPGATASGLATTAAEYTVYQQAGISFAPVFNAPFSANPASLVGGNTAYTWLAFDSNDSPAAQALHQGLIYTNSQPASFVDLTQVTGPNSIGQTLPVLFGPSSGSGATYGWSIDFAIKPLAVQTWSKLIDLGTGAGIDSLYFGWQSNNNLWEFGDIITVSNALAGGSGSDIGSYTNVLNAPVIGRWYHLAWVMQPASTDAVFNSSSASIAATWTIYVNGVAVISKFAGNTPLPVFRHVSYIGRSDWFQAGNGDQNTNALYDAFRVWDRALTSAQVMGLAKAYGTAQVFTGGDFGVAAALAGGKLPVFEANFTYNPASVASVGPTAYGWVPSDSSDSTANQGVHQGIAVLQGATNGNSWINISTASGPNSMGIVAPVIGGPGSGTAAAGNQGWSFEFVFKPSAAEYRTWAKLLDMGNGQVNSPYGTSMPPNADDWTIGFDGNDQTKFLVETYNSGTINYTHCTIETEAIAPSTWYHMAVVITPAPGQAAAQGGANWYVYVNGQMQNWAYPLNGGAPLSLSYLQGANYPQPVARPQSYIGKSDWADPVMDAEVDAVRIYDYALSMAVVQNLAALYGLNASTPTFPPAGSSAPGFTATAAEFTAPAQAAGLTFQPVFNAPFATNPAQLVGGSTAYTWMAFDPADSAAQQALHRGLINVNAAPTSYIDLAQVTGANSIGQTLPVLFGPSSGSGSTYGWSIDLCIKPLASQTWSKLIDLGTGAYIDSLYFGWQSNSNLWEFGNYITVQNSLAFPAGTSGTSFLQYTNVLEAPVLGQWYHLAWVMIPQSTDATFATAAASTMATWNIYVNGLLAVTMLGNTPLPLFRHVSYLGRSDWFQAGNGDQNLNATFDAFRVWDRALTAAQVQALSQTLYGLGLPPSVTSVSAGGDFSLQAALGTTARLPVFNANFSQNPNTIASVGPVTYYQWAPFDPTDSAANQGQHQGLAVLTGTPLSFINISTASGPQSCGLVAPMIGGAGSGTAAAGTVGWSFEFVWKPVGESRTWAKLLDMGNGPANGPQNWYLLPNADDWTIGFDGNDQTQFLLETYNNLTLQYSHAYTELQALTMGAWYHMVVVQTPVGTAGAGLWYVYVNGLLQNWAYPLNGGAAVTTVPQQGANYPSAIPRPRSYIGASDWADPTLIAMVDAVRIYDYALSGTQVSALANMYGMLAPAQPYAAPGSTASGLVTTGAEYSIYTQAGISFAPVFNAAFGTDPTSAVGGSLAYTWLASDPKDSAAVAAKHQGIVSLNGSPTQFLDVTQTSGPNSCGQSLPILFGNSSGSGAAYGWSIDFVIKPLSVQTWSKLFDFGTGAAIDSLYMGWQSNNNLWEMGSFITVSNALAGGPGNAGSSLGSFTNFLNAPVIGAWYHLAWVMQPASTDSTFSTAGASVAATWTIYVNGVAVVSNFAGNTPIPVFRHVSYIGRSDWFQAGNGDQNTNALYDAFRVWDRALTSAQVMGLAKAYGTAQVFTGGDFGVAAALAGGKLPVFEANFTYNPASVASVGPTAYGWVPSDSSDSTANQGVHQGIAVLQGATNGNSWINISTASGPNSMGIVAPVIGGPGSGTAAAGNQGWSFEFVFKPSAAEYRTWAKLLDMGNGQVNSPYGTSMPPNADDWTIGFDGNDQTKFLVETYNSGTINYTHCTIETEAIAPSTWYHMAVVITPAPGQAAAQGGANWYVYVNGQMQNWAYPLNGGAPLSLSYLQGANYPQPVARPQSYIGKSDWADPVMDAEVDAVRIYDYALSMAVVQNLAALYGLNASTPTFPPAGSSAPGFTATAAEFTAPAQAAGLTFQPVFNAPFATNPAQLVGGSTAYTWMAFDPADSAAQQALHRGLINVNAAPTSYIDLAQVTGANSIGQTLPVLFGPSSGSGSTYGWSIDLCIKPLASQTWSKLIDLGTGAYIDSLYFGWQSNSNLWEFGNYITVQNSLAFPAGTSGTSFLQYTNVLEAPVLGQWYHLAWVMIPQSTDATFATAAASTMATWNIYVNGLLAVTMLGNTPLPLFRHVSYLGRSDWFQAGNGDQNLNATFDAFRVWDRALTAAQVQALSQTLYGLGLPPSVTSVSAGGDFSLQAALGTTARLPVFNANFSQNPNTIASVGPVTYYQWAPFDPSDSAANQGQHQGLAVLTGTPLSFINISTASGPQSCGLVAPMIGGAGSGTAAAGTVGWSFEFVWKPVGESRTWAKLLDMGNGPANGPQNWYLLPNADDWTIGFDGNDQTQFLLETYNNLTLQYSHAYTELQALTMGAWYHMVVVQTPVGTAGAGLWYVYVNGLLQNWAYPLNGGAAVTTVPQQGANYPSAIPRPRSYIGASDWADPTLIAMVDAVRIYDYALSGTQVSALANMYGMLAPAQPYAAPGSTASGLVTTGAEYSIYTQAGISFAPVFNAAFGSDPTSAVGGSIAYTWLANDVNDNAANQSLHKGIVSLNGSPTQFLDVTQTSGPNSCGQSLPILFGNSSGSGAAYGWSIDFVIKPLSVQTWSKLFDFGTGAAIDSLYMGWQSNNNLWEMGSFITVSNALAGGPGNAGSSLGSFTNFLNAPVIGAWYHLAWVMQPASTDSTFSTAGASVAATWTIYVNGVAVVSNFAGNTPIPVFRHVSYIGRSDWFQAGNGDQNTNALYDAFRVWDRALNATQVQGMAGQYGLNQFRPAPSSSAAPAVSSSAATAAASSAANTALRSSATSPASSAATSPATAAATSLASSAQTSAAQATSAATSRATSAATSAPTSAAATTTPATSPATSAARSAATSAPTSAPTLAATSTPVVVTSAPASSTAGPPVVGSSSSSSSLSGGAIAGIVIGSVVGAFVLCALVFCLFCAGGRRQKAEPAATGSEVSKVSQMEYDPNADHSQVGTSTASPDEVEMGDMHGSTDGATAHAE